MLNKSEDIYIRDAKSALAGAFFFQYICIYSHI